MTGRNGDAPPPARRFYRVRQIVEEYGFTKSHVHKLIRQGRVQAKKLDGVVIIPAEAWEAYIATAQPWTPGTGGEAA